jgi:catechol 2,3-dioxygenase-like lactoylglutathione lyase family enzyme
MSRQHDLASSPLKVLRDNLKQRAALAEQRADRIFGWLALATLIVLLGGAALGGWPRAISASAPLQTSAANVSAPAAVARDVATIGIVVDDMDRSVAFYRDVLTFNVIRDVEVLGDSYERLLGIFGVRLRIVTLQLGDEQIELTEFLVPKGRPIPPDSRSNDRWFQHIAIITNDMERAYAHLRAHKVRHASTGPQLLPQWNPNAGGISAFYFYDPDGHVLEILQFPPDKGNPKWQREPRSAQVFLGIDHTAIVVHDTEASLRFYRDVLGMHIAGASENYGTEQEHLNNVFGARLRITSVRPPAETLATGPSIEFLEYLTPRDGRPYPSDARSNDLFAWQTTVVAEDIADVAARLRAAGIVFVSPNAVDLGAAGLAFRAALLARDPDGHVIRFVQR